MNFLPIKEKLTALLKNKYFLIGILLFLVILICYPKSKSVKSDNTSQQAGDPTFSGEDFENKLESILSDIRGVKNARVLLSFEGGTKYIYAEDISKTESDGRSTSSTDTVIAGGEAVVVGSVNPKITGAVVVYSGTRSSSVRLDILEAVMAATSLSSDKITVLCGG